jgi:Flp pilus assembly protein TadB
MENPQASLHAYLEQIEARMKVNEALLLVLLEALTEAETRQLQTALEQTVRVLADREAAQGRTAIAEAMQAVCPTLPTLLAEHRRMQ